MQPALRVIDHLKIPDVVLIQPLVVSPNTLLQDVIGQMQQTRCDLPSTYKTRLSAKCNCVLIVDNDQLLGIFTERDLIQNIATGQAMAQIAVAAVMSSFEIVQPTEDVTLLGLGQLMNHYHTQCLPVLNQANQVLGVVTSESLCYCLQTRWEPKLNQASALTRPNQTQPVQVQTEQASGAWLQGALAVAQVGIWDLDWHTGKQTWSAETLALFAYPPDAEASQAIFWQRVHPEDWALVKQAYREAKQTGVYQVDYRLLLPDQTVRWLSSKGKVFFDQTGQPIRMTGTNIDISQQKQTETTLKTALQEKEVLLEEVQHRMKNNLQVISSTVRMQARRCTDPQVVELLQEVQNRVQAMALIHEQLYQSSPSAQVDFEAYLHPLMEFLLSAYGVSAERVQVSIHTQGLLLSLNQAILCGLIVSELVSNALKHAFPDHQRGEVAVSLTSQQFGTTTTVTLGVWDNGVSISPALNWQAPSSLGLKIIQSLVAQLKGVMQVDLTQGTAFHITFPYVPHPQAGSSRI